MAAELTGTPVAIAFGLTQNPAGQDITVPADCTAVYAFFSGFPNSASGSVASCTLEGVSPSEIHELSGDGSNGWTAVYAWYNPATGAGQTLDPAWDDTQIEGVVCIVAFVKGGNTTAWRDADADYADGSGPTTVTLTTVAGDLVLKFDVLFSTTAPSLSAGWTNAQTQANQNDRSGRLSYIAAAGATQACDSEDEDFSTVVAVSIPSGTPRDQEGFRWGVDDGNEASHGWEANQDTSITIADDQSRLIRVLVNATGDSPSTAYTLRYQKNGSGGYVAVPVGSVTKTTPVIETGDATSTGNNTASASWAVGYPNASTGDLLIFCISWDDSTATTDVSEPAGPNGETLSEVNATPATDSGTTVRCKVWYTKATGTWTASTLTFTPSASEQWTASVIRVPAGEFDATTPIGASDTEGVTGTGANVQHGAFSAGASDGSGKLCVWTATDANPQTVAAGFSQVANVDRGAVAGGFYTRDTAVSDSESFSATTAATQTAAGWSTVAFVVRAPSVTNEVYVVTSANIAAGGEDTTARLTAPSGKTTSDFTTGRRWDNENGSDSIDIATDFYTEVEWLVYLASTLNADDFVDFRVYAGSGALDTYTVTPRWTIPSAGGGSTLAPGTWAMMGVGL